MLVRINILIVLLTLVSSVCAQDNRWVTYYKSGKFKRAAKTLEANLKKNKNDAQLWNFLGLSYVELGQFKKASKSFKKATKLQPTNSQYLTNYGLVQYQQNKYSGAQSSLSKAIQLDPKNNLARLLRAMVYIQRKNNPKALEDLNATINGKTRNPLAYELRASIYAGDFSVNWSDGNRNESTIKFLDAAAKTMKQCVLVCESQKQYAASQATDFQYFYDYYLKIITEAAENPLPTGRAAPSLSDDKNCEGFRITYKPRPGYTEFARKQGITGSITMRVMFKADGTIGPTIIEEGLPGGLNQKATIAAKSIRFDPLVCNGTAKFTVKVLVFNFRIY